MKRKISHFLVLCIAFTCLTGIVAAQDKEKQTPKLTAEQRTEKRVTHLKEKLNLTTEQAAKVKNLILAQEKIRESNREELKDSHQKMMGEMEKILTPQQMENLKALQEKQKLEMKSHYKKNHSESPELKK